MRKGERKRQLLAAAAELFAARGFAAVTTADVATAADTTPGRLARYFSEHTSLVRAVLTAAKADAFPPPHPADAAHDAATRLQAFLDRAAAAAQKPTPGYRALLRALVELTDADNRAELQAILLEASEPLVGILQSGQQAGVIRRSLDTADAAWELVQAILGYALTGPRAAGPREDGRRGRSMGCCTGC